MNQRTKKAPRRSLGHGLVLRWNTLLEFTIRLLCAGVSEYSLEQPDAPRRLERENNPDSGL